MLEIEDGVNAIRRTDENALLIVNFGLNAEGLDQMLQYLGENMDVDILSNDDYTRSQEAYKQLEKFRSAGLRYGMPYWRYLRAYRYAGSSEWPTESDMRWNAFSGLVYGYTGHTGNPVLLKYKTHSSVGVRINGIKPAMAACNNQDTDQFIVTDHGVPMFRCADVQLIDREGESVQAGILGTVNPPIFSASSGMPQQEPLTGYVVGLKVTQVVCKNEITGQKVTIDNGEAAWDCSAAGLEANEGDQVLVYATGTIPAK